MTREGRERTRSCDTCARAERVDRPDKSLGKDVTQTAVYCLWKPPGWPEWAVRELRNGAAPENRQHINQLWNGVGYLPENCPAYLKLEEHRP